MILKNKTYFMQRWDTLKGSIFEDPEICLDRARLITESYKETESLPQIIRVAKSFEKILKEMKIYIQPEELLVGNLAGKPMATPIYPEIGVTFILENSIVGFFFITLHKYLSFFS